MIETIFGLHGKIFFLIVLAEYIFNINFSFNELSDNSDYLAILSFIVSFELVFS